jgi:uncharacterized protein (TIGR00255 family)
MTIASMTGFARGTGITPFGRYSWEIKAVNAKGLDLRLRLAQGFDAIEPEARALVAKALSRGTVYATLTLQRDTAAPDIRVNLALLNKLVASLTAIDLQGRLAPATLDGLLAVRGIVEVSEAEDDAAAIEAARAGVLAGLESALVSLVAMRRGEGEVLACLLGEKLDRIKALTAAAGDSPALAPEAIRARLSQSIALLAGHANFDENRLHQEALILAVKSDIREELDRLLAHAEAARVLLAKGGAVGRRLDFLAQELGREASTLCAKSNDASLTEIGLELRVEIEQFREQIQNLE